MTPIRALGHFLPNRYPPRHVLGTGTWLLTAAMFVGLLRLNFDVLFFVAPFVAVAAVILGGISIAYGPLRATAIVEIVLGIALTIALALLFTMGMGFAVGFGD